MTRSALFTSLSDLSDNDLFVFARDSAASANKLLDSSRALISSSGSTQKEKLSGLALSYRAANLSFRSDDAFSLIRAREDIRYSVPVAGKSMPTDYPFIPGSMRPYRRDTTDGIHHGWDIMAAV
ncbi:MAG: Peptidase protein [Patescibacteria group bacterium]|nr:Peptidase protein [Patescibacteria group bacterium]